MIARKYQTALASTALFALVAGCGAEEEPKPAGSGFVRANGNELVDARGNPLVLRSMRFNNWLDAPDEPFTTHHDEGDFERVAALGLNSIEFAMSYRWFEDDAEPFVYENAGFDWLDQNIAWAKTHGLLLILSLAEPPGGRQTPCEDGVSLWNDAENQDRVVSLWSAIAARYAGENTVAGYSLLKMPAPTDSLAQWQDLAVRSVEAVRRVDSEHLVIVGLADSLKCNYSLSPEQAFPNVFDSNLAYGFAFDLPWEYTHQLLAVAGRGDDGHYPDDSRLALSWWHVPETDGWLGSSEDSTPGPEALRLKPEETEWTRKGFVYTINDPDYDFASLVFESNNNPGTACLDDVVVKEYAGEFGEMEFVRTVVDIDPELATEWFLWEEKPEIGTGRVTQGEDGVRGSQSVCLSGTNVVTHINRNLLFPVPLGHTFEVTYWVKGENTAPKAEALMKLDFFRYDTELSFRNRAGLTRVLDEYLDLSAARNVPFYAYQLGTGRPTFENDKGGIAWARDVLELARERGLSFVYNQYHSEEFGVYGGNSGLPDPETANQDLIDLFREMFVR